MWAIVELGHVFPLRICLLPEVLRLLIIKTFVRKRVRVRPFVRLGCKASSPFSARVGFDVFNLD
jgi:hypothetical protein